MRYLLSLPVVKTQYYRWSRKLGISQRFIISNMVKKRKKESKKLQFRLFVWPLCNVCGERFKLAL